MGNFHSIAIVKDLNGITKVDPGTTYVEWDTKLRFKIDFKTCPIQKMRLVVTAQATEAGTSGIKLYNVTDGADVADTYNTAEVTWNVTTLIVAQASSWCLPKYRKEIEFAVYVKGYSLTEDITAYSIELQLMDELG